MAIHDMYEKAVDEAVSDVVQRLSEELRQILLGHNKETLCQRQVRLRGLPLFLENHQQHIG